MQRNVLHRREAELASMRNSYAGFYDFAPIAYVAINDQGIILQANLTLADWLGAGRKQLIGDQFARFIDPGYSDPWRLYIARLLKHHGQQRCELALRRDDGSCLAAQLDSLPAVNDDKAILHIALTDISERKKHDAPGRSVRACYADPVQRDELLMALLQKEQRQQELLQENRALIRRLMQVQEKERRLLARDLHDELGQLLTSIKTRAEFIARHVQDSELRDVAAEIVRDTSASFDASNAMLLKLRPGVLDILGLAAALTELTGQWKKQAGVSCALHINGDIDHLSELHAIAIYRLIQEGLTNARRHGKATCVELIVTHVPPHAGREGRAIIEINDNGKGLRGQQAHKGLGIIGMRERVHALGGTFLLTDIPGDGVRIEAVLPLSGEDTQ